MNVKRWLLAGLAAFAAVFVVDFVVHGRLLMGLYQQTSAIWRPEAEANQKMRLMMLGQLLFGLIFAAIYIKGYEPRKAGAGQGIRYGLWIGLLLAVPAICVWYVVLPIPFALARGWALAHLAECLVAGALVGFIYQPED